MNGYVIFFSVSFAVSAVFCLFLVLKTFLTKNPSDPAEAKGRILSGILYSFTLAMSPLKKETAYMHWPTYAAGIMYHTGIFLGFFMLAVHLFSIELPYLFSLLTTIVFGLAFMSGTGILIKRGRSSRMKYFSTPDDYFSNGIVTGFILISLLTVVFPGQKNILFVYAGLLLLYLPLGKLRHAVFFPLTRLHLGAYYGKRGVWPPPKRVQ